MNRFLLFVVLPVLAAAASAWNLVSFRLSNLLDPAIPDATTIAWYGAFAVSAVALVFAFLG